MESNNFNEVFEEFESPIYFKKKYPLSKEASETVKRARQEIKNILDKTLKRDIYLIN
jgi:phospho-2-dehydro-3-deoxyheptonate aldolase